MNVSTKARFALQVLATCMILASCATVKPEPQVRIVTEKVAVPTACVTEATPQPPTYPDTDEAVRAAPSPGIRYSLIAAGRLLRIQRLAEVEPALQACRVP